jgi:hypothetical protein
MVMLAMVVVITHKLIPEVVMLDQTLVVEVVEVPTITTPIKAVKVDLELLS